MLQYDHINMTAVYLDSQNVSSGNIYVNRQISGIPCTQNFDSIFRNIIECPLIDEIRYYHLQSS